MLTSGQSPAAQLFTLKRMETTLIRDVDLECL